MNIEQFKSVKKIIKERGETNVDVYPDNVVIEGPSRFLDPDGTSYLVTRQTGKGPFGLEKREVDRVSQLGGATIVEKDIAGDIIKYYANADLALYSAVENMKEEKRKNDRKVEKARRKLSRAVVREAEGLLLRTEENSSK